MISREKNHHLAYPEGYSHTKYSVLIRGDYSYALNQLSNNWFDRDKLIKQAIETFLENYTLEQREEEIHRTESQVRIASVPGAKSSYRMFSEFVYRPSNLVERVTQSYPSLDSVLNTALRVYLQLKVFVDRHRPTHHISVFTEERKVLLDYWWDGVNFHILWTRTL